MTLKKRLIKGGLWVAISSVLVAIFAYLFRVILIKNISIIDYGLYYSIVAVFLFATTFIDLGRTSALVKYSSDALAKNKKSRVKALIKYYFKFKFKTGIVFLIVVLASAKFLSENYFKDERAFYLFIALGVIYLLYDTIFQVVLSLFKIFQDQKSHALYEAIRSGMLVVLVLIFLKSGLGIWSPVLSLISVSILVSLFFYYLFYKKHFPNFFKTKSEKINTLLPAIKTFAAANLFFHIGSYILNYTDTFMLIYFTDLTQVGLYNVAVPTAKIILLVMGVFTLILMPVISNLFTQRKFETMNKLINMTYKLSLIFILPICLIMISYPDLILKVLFSMEHVAASVSLQFLSIGALFSVLFFINNNIFNGINKPKINSKMILGGSIFNILLNFALIPKYGINGAAFATMCGYILMCFVSFIYLKKEFKELKIDLTILIKLTVSGMVFLIGINYLKKYLELNSIILETLLVLFISGMIYASMLLVLKVVNIRNIKNLFRRYVR
jgi:O-antigen/teichoic acid export membrane protein